jgi:hypothetical protein
MGPRLLVLDDYEGRVALVRRERLGGLRAEAGSG